jgi:hypothetical protein
MQHAGGTGMASQVVGVGTGEDVRLVVSVESANLKAYTANL